MNKNLVVKANLLIEASYKLDLVEMRLILLAIIEARESKTLIDANSLMKISAKRYAEMFGVSLKNSYSLLKVSAKTLFDRQFSYFDWEFDLLSDDTSKIFFTSRWVSKVGYKPGFVYLSFAPDVIPLISRLEKEFTRYDLLQISKFSSIYAVRIYEMCMQWKAVKKFYVSLADLRQRLDLQEDELTRIDNFKKKVIEVAKEQINESSDILIDYVPIKSGTKITGFEFTIKSKIPQLVKRPTTLNNKQIFLFANKLAHEPSFASKYSKVGENYDEFALRISEQLIDPKKLEEYLPYLEKVGFQSA